MNLQTKSCEIILRILKYWECCVIDVVGLFGCLVVVWNPKTCFFKPFMTCDGILLEEKGPGFENFFHLLNIYAHYKDRTQFWDKIEDSGLFSVENLVIAGDLNLTLHSFEN